MNKGNKNYSQVILPWFFTLLLCACQPTRLRISRISDSQTPSFSHQIATSVLSSSPVPTDLPTPSPSPLLPKFPTSTPQSYASSTPSPSATQTASSQFMLCSPLAWETIPELWEIISDPYNPPPMGSDERHQGVDFSHYSRKGYKTIEGEPVQAVLAGRVSAVIKDRLPYGNMVMIETTADHLPGNLRNTLGVAEGESLYILYAHFGSESKVSLGEEVDCGQVIGEVGLTGYNIVNPHLHLETRLGPSGVKFESMAFYTTSATNQEMENYRRWRMSGDFRHFDPMILFSHILDENP